MEYARSMTNVFIHRVNVKHLSQNLLECFFIKGNVCKISETYFRNGLDESNCIY